MKARSLLTIACVLTLVIGCSTTDDFNPVYRVPESFEWIVNQFITEAEDRGIYLTISNLIMEHDPDLGLLVCGNCNSSDLEAQIQKIITIDPDSHCWENDQQFEALIFHELGHCILGRFHSTELLPNGAPKSLMVQGDVTVYSPCVYPIGDDSCNKTARRNYYIDELFDENTPVPEWAL